MDLKKLFGKNWIYVLFSVLGVIAVIFLLSRIPLGEALKTFSHATIQLVVLYLICQVVIVSLLSLRWQLILKSQGIKNVSFVSIVMYWLCGWTVGFLTPSAKLGGEPVRAGLMNKKHNIPFHKALSGVVIDKTLELSTSALFFVLGGVILLIGYVLAPGFRNVIIVVSIIFIVLLFMFNYQVMRGKKFFIPLFQAFGLFKIKRFRKWKTKIHEFEELIVKFYHKDKKYFLLTLLVSLAAWSMMFIEYKAAAAIVGYDLTILQIFFVFSFVGAAYIMPVPMGLGALEAGQVGLFQAFSINPAAGLALGLLIRIKDTIQALIGSVMLTYYGLQVKEAVKHSGRLEQQVTKVRREQRRDEKSSVKLEK